MISQILIAFDFTARSEALKLWEKYALIMATAILKKMTFKQFACISQFGDN